MKCAVSKCKQSNSNKTSTGNYVGFYCFPRNEPQKQQWIKFCNRGTPMKTHNQRICGHHFRKEDFERNLRYEMGFSSRRTLKLKPGVVPTIYTSVISKEKKPDATIKKPIALPSTDISDDSSSRCHIEKLEVVAWEENNSPHPMNINDDSNEINIEYEKPFLESTTAIKEESLDMDIKPFELAETSLCHKNNSMQNEYEPLLHIETEETAVMTETAICDENNSMSKVYDPLLSIKTEEAALMAQANEDRLEIDKKINQNISISTEINEDSIQRDVKPLETPTYEESSKPMATIFNIHSPELHIKTEETFELSNINENNPNICDNEEETPEIIQLEMNKTLINEESNVPMQIDVTIDSLLLHIKSLEKEIDTLRLENDMLRNDMQNIKNLSSQVNNLSLTNANYENALKRLFTENQIKKLKDGDGKQNYTPADIAQSIILYRESPQAYNLLKNKNFPLPSLRTLQRWSQKSKLNKNDDTTVILDPVALLSASEKMTAEQKLCTLNLNEMSGSNPKVALLRGLNSKWKQTIYYNYDRQMEITILFNMLKTINRSKLKIVAIVSDLGDWNRQLFNELKVTFSKPWFLFEETKIFVFNDVPQLIKLMRHNFVSRGFKLNNREIKKDIILELLSPASSDLKINRKVLEHIFNFDGPERHKVKLAAKLFSHTVANYITNAASLGLLSNQNWSECSQLFKLINDWIDILSSKTSTEATTEQKNAYGFQLETQNNILNNMSLMMSEIRVIGETDLLPFQEGIIQTNNALKMLRIELEKRYNIEHIFAYRLNPDI